MSTSNALCLQTYYIADSNVDIADIFVSALTWVTRNNSNNRNNNNTNNSNNNNSNSNNNNNNNDTNTNTNNNSNIQKACKAIVWMALPVQRYSSNTANLPTNIVPDNIAWVKLSGTFPTEMKIPPPIN